MIQLINIKKQFYLKNNNVQVLKNINLTIPEGHIVGIVGKSGAGKSTLLRCINLLEKPDEGKVFINSVSLTDLNPRDLRLIRRNIGMIFQNFNLLNCSTVFKNVAFPLELAGFNKKEIYERVNQMLEMTGILEKALNYPAQLSGGQKQRVGIARALVSEAKILLCDEPSSSLDEETTKSILSLLQRMNKELGITVAIISHELESLKSICNSIVTLENGEICYKKI